MFGIAGDQPSTPTPRRRFNFFQILLAMNAIYVIIAVFNLHLIPFLLLGYKPVLILTLFLGIKHYRKKGITFLQVLLWMNILYLFIGALNANHIPFLLIGFKPLALVTLGVLIFKKLKAPQYTKHQPL